MKMNEEDEIALGESISDWKDKVIGRAVNRECPLCTLGKERSGNQYKCEHCIIHKHTGRVDCRDTPFTDDDLLFDYHQREVEFLESLRPEKKAEKDVIKIGDEVIIRDPSYLFRLNNGKIGDRNDKGFQDTNYLYPIYIVLEIGIQLPEGSDHRGKYGNDTIIYNPKDDSYVFTHHKFLNKAICPEPKHCPECGKAK